MKQILHIKVIKVSPPPACSLHTSGPPQTGKGSPGNSPPRHTPPGPGNKLTLVVHFKEKTLRKIKANDLFSICNLSFHSPKD